MLEALRARMNEAMGGDVNRRLSCRRRAMSSRDTICPRRDRRRKEGEIMSLTGCGDVAVDVTTPRAHVGYDP